MICPFERCFDDFSMKHVGIGSKGGIANRRNDSVESILERHAEKANGTG